MMENFGLDDWWALSAAENPPDDEGDYARAICNICGADIPADGACWYCENKPNLYPKLLLIKSWVLICAGCHSWCGRAPQWCGTGDKGDRCYKCGSTSFEIREGRPFGPRCRNWEWMADEFYSMYATLGDDEELLSGVKIQRT